MEIKISPQNESIFQDLFPQIQEWLNSQEFAQNYAHKQFPPLLNPQKIPYFKIPASLAWELNLPLPNIYKFVFVGSHGIGNAGYNAFFKFCGGSAVYDNCDFHSSFVSYARFYESLLKMPFAARLLDSIEIESNITNEPSWCYISMINFPIDKEYEKLFALMPTQFVINALNDPILMLTHYLNQRRNYTNLEISMNESFYEKMCAQICYMGSSFTEKLNAPSLKSVSFWLGNIFSTFHQGQIIKALNCPQIITIDMPQICGEQAFPTFTQLSSLLDFPSPKEEHKFLFTRRVSEFNGILPAFLKTDSIKIGLFGAFQKTNLVQITQNLGEEISEICEKNALCVGVENLSDFALLQIKQDELNSVKIKIKEMIFDALKLAKHGNLEQIGARRINGADLIQYFAVNPAQRALARSVFAFHLKLISENKADLVASWKDYSSFCELCENCGDGAIEPLNLGI